MKKALALILASIMLLALCACGGSIDTGKLDEILTTLESIEAQVDALAGETASAPAAPASPAEAPAEDVEEEPEAPAAAESTAVLPIGLMVNQTGWFAMVDAPNYYEFNAMID